MASTRIATAGALAGLLLGAGLMVGGAAGAAGSRSVTALVDGRAVRGATSGNPVTVHPERTLTLEVRVTNNDVRDLEIKTVRLTGRVMGLTFYRVDTSVDFIVPGASTITRDFPIDVSGLGDEAIGLIPSSVSVLDANHRTVASQGTLVDVRGSWHSVYGLFGLLVVLVAALTFVRTMTRVARHKLSPNRLVRAASFLPIGISVGLTIVFAFSAARILAPTGALWIPVLLLSCLVAFAAGYASPAPVLDEDDEDDDAGFGIIRGGAEDDDAPPASGIFRFP